MDTLSAAESSNGNEEFSVEQSGDSLESSQDDMDASEDNQPPDDYVVKADDIETSVHEKTVKTELPNRTEKINPVIVDIANLVHNPAVSIEQKLDKKYNESVAKSFDALKDDDKSKKEQEKKNKKEKKKNAKGGPPNDEPNITLAQLVKFLFTNLFVVIV